jgi:hypothetical protein
MWTQVVGDVSRRQEKPNVTAAQIAWNSYHGSIVLSEYEIPALHNQIPPEHEHTLHITRLGRKIRRNNVV